MSFQGYLLKSGNAIFPDKYIDYESWDSTPNQREEIKAYRDDNTRDLTRVTAAGRKTALTFKTRDGLNLAEKMEIQKFFTDHETNHAERKVPLTFWNDEDNEYKTGDFYRPNTKFTIKSITDDDIFYNAIQIDLVEY